MSPIIFIWWFGVMFVSHYYIKCSHEFGKVVQVVFEVVVSGGFGDEPGDPLDKLLVETLERVVLTSFSFPRFDHTFDATPEPLENVSRPSLFEEDEALVFQNDGQDQPSSQEST